MRPPVLAEECITIERRARFWNRLFKNNRYYFTSLASSFFSQRRLGLLHTCPEINLPFPSSSLLSIRSKEPFRNARSAALLPGSASKRKVPLPNQFTTTLLPTNCLTSAHDVGRSYLLLAACNVHPRTTHPATRCTT